MPLDIFWPRLIAIADEMATTLVRTAFTHDVIEVRDMSTGLYDDRGYLIAQTWLGATGHVGVMPVFGKSVLEAFPALYHEPYFKSYLRDDLGAMLEEAGFDVEPSVPAFLAKVVVGRKPADT